MTPATKTWLYKAAWSGCPVQVDKATVQTKASYISCIGHTKYSCVKATSAMLSYMLMTLIWSKLKRARSNLGSPTSQVLFLTLAIPPFHLKFTLHNGLELLVVLDVFIRTLNLIQAARMV